MPPALSDLSARELLTEWRKLIDAATGSLSSMGDPVEAPRQLLEMMRGQLEMVQELIARERRLQQHTTSQLLAPLDAVFDLLESSGKTLRKQAEALEAAGQALEETARLVKDQAVLFERTIGTLREPSDWARTALGLDPRQAKQARRTSKDTRRRSSRRS